MNTPYPCYQCGNLYVNVLFKNDPSYTAECQAESGWLWGNKTCPHYVHEDEGGWRHRPASHTGRADDQALGWDALVESVHKVAPPEPAPPALPPDQKWSWENYEYFDSYETADAARCHAEKTPWPHIQWKVKRLADGRFALRRGIAVRRIGS